jgi:hypothetical protein
MDLSMPPFLFRPHTLLVSRARPKSFFAILLSFAGHAPLGMSFFLPWIILLPLFTGQAPNSPALAPDPTVQGMLDQVQSSILYDYVAGLSGEQSVTIGGDPFSLDTRSTMAADYIEKATQYAYEHFQSLDLAVSYQAWQYGGGQRRNVVAEQGGTDPDCQYLLTAHLDDTSSAPYTLAPGADDNASGVAGVFLAADILSQYQFTCTLRYVLFTGEEQGMYGSDAYARAAANRGDPILGVLNLDMIAYNTPGSPTAIEMNVRSGPNGDQDQVLSTMVSDVIQAYELDLIPQVLTAEENYSDHYSFWEAGFPAILAIEDLDDSTPSYHTIDDTVDTLDMPYFTEYVKAMVGAMAHLGKVTSEPPPSFHIYLPLTQN